MRRNFSYLIFSVVLVLALSWLTVKIYRHPSQVEARIRHQLLESGLEQHLRSLEVSGGVWHSNDTCFLDRLELRLEEASGEVPFLVLDKTFIYDGQIHSEKVPPWVQRELRAKFHTGSIGTFQVGQILHSRDLAIQLSRGTGVQGQTERWNFSSLFQLNSSESGASTSSQSERNLGGPFYLSSEAFEIGLDISSPFDPRCNSGDPHRLVFKGKDLQVGGGGNQRSVLAKGEVLPSENWGKGDFQFELDGTSFLNKFHLRLERLACPQFLSYLPFIFSHLDHSLGLQGTSDIQLDWVRIERELPGAHSNPKAVSNTEAQSDASQTKETELQLTGKVHHFDSVLSIPGTPLLITGVSGPIRIVDDLAQFGSTEDELRTPLKGSLGANEISLGGKIDPSKGQLSMAFPRFPARELNALCEGMVDAGEALFLPQKILHFLQLKKPRGELSLNWILNWGASLKDESLSWEIEVESGDLVFPQLPLLKRGRTVLKLNGFQDEARGELQFKNSELAAFGLIDGKASVKIIDGAIQWTIDPEGLELGEGSKPGILQGHLSYDWKSGNVSGELTGKEIEFVLGDDDIRSTIEKVTLQPNEEKQFEVKLHLKTIEVRSLVYSQLSERSKRALEQDESSTDFLTFAEGEATLVLTKDRIQVSYFKLKSPKRCLQLTGSFTWQGVFKDLKGALVWGEEEVKAFEQIKLTPDLKTWQPQLPKNKSAIIEAKGNLSQPRLSM